MNKKDYVEKEVAAKEEKMSLDAHNKTTLRSILGKEFEDNERSTRDYSEYDAGEPNKGDYKLNEY